MRKKRANRSRNETIMKKKKKRNINKRKEIKRKKEITFNESYFDLEPII